MTLIFAYVYGRTRRDCVRCARLLLSISVHIGVIEAKSIWIGLFSSAMRIGGNWLVRVKRGGLKKSFLGVCEVWLD